MWITSGNIQYKQQVLIYMCICTIVCIYVYNLEFKERFKPNTTCSVLLPFTLVEEALDLHGKANASNKQIFLNSIVKFMFRLYFVSGWKRFITFWINVIFLPIGQYEDGTRLNIVIKSKIDSLALIRIKMLLFYMF